MTAVLQPDTPSGAYRIRKAQSVTTPTPARRRLDHVDLLRGLVMVIMVLDHERAYFTNAHFDPTDLNRTDLALFGTRWITHFCAPVFVFLAGASAWMAGTRRTPGQLSRFLLSRGLWLVFLEFTVITFGWYFTTDLAIGVVAQVIWAIGGSMVVLAGLVRLPRVAVAGFGAALVLGHNLFDGLAPDALGRGHGSRVRGGAVHLRPGRAGGAAPCPCRRRAGRRLHRAPRAGRLWRPRPPVP